MLGPTHNLGPIGLAVLTLLATHGQTDKQTDTQKSKEYS